jgi:hypothetical protein
MAVPASFDPPSFVRRFATFPTTERYLGVHQDLYDAPCDYIRLDLAAAN